MSWRCRQLHDQSKHNHHKSNNHNKEKPSMQVYQAKIPRKSFIPPTLMAKYLLISFSFQPIKQPLSMLLWSPRSQETTQIPKVSLKLTNFSLFLLWFSLGFLQVFSKFPSLIFEISSNNSPSPSKFRDFKDQKGWLREFTKIPLGYFLIP